MEISIMESWVDNSRYKLIFSYKLNKEYFEGSEITSVDLITKAIYAAIGSSVVSLFGAKTYANFLLQSYRGDDHRVNDIINSYTEVYTKTLVTVSKVLSLVGVIGYSLKEMCVSYNNNLSEKEKVNNHAFKMEKIFACPKDWEVKTDINNEHGKGVWSVNIECEANANIEKMVYMCAGQKIINDLKGNDDYDVTFEPNEYDFSHSIDNYDLTQCSEDYKSEL